MGTSDILNKLMSALNSFSDRDLRDLADLFNEPGANEAIAKVIQGTLSLREAKRRSKLSSKRRSAVSIAHKERDIEKAIPESNSGLSSAEQMRKELTSFLLDKKIFSSTRDVVHAINISFGRQIDYRDFYKRGRRDLISRFLRELSSYSEEEQRRMIKEFMGQVNVQSAETDEGYKRLFKILAGDD